MRCGYAAIIGRPNVGKSTLMNRLLRQKISITSSRPQTTRHRILGIATAPDVQVIYVDTPGLHRAGKKALNRYMNRTAQSVIHDVDAVLWVVEGMRWTEEDEDILRRLEGLTVPVILVVNKVDHVAEKGRLLPHLQTLAGKRQFAEIVPVSARTGANVESLEQAVAKYMPEGEAMYPDDQVTDRSERFLAAEFIREKLMRRLGQELPYVLTVEIEKFAREGNLARIHAVIWVERDSHKAIIIGKNGERLKEVGREAREDMERTFDCKVFLELWVRVKSGWSDDERALASLGYTDQ